jgi:hypothetical protein
MKIYIAGKITGLSKQHVEVVFNHAEKFCLTKGWDPINPTKLCKFDEQWDVAMDMCLAALDKCDAIFLLDSWTTSPGAKLEVAHAIKMNLPIFTFKDLQKC